MEFGISLILFWHNMGLKFWWVWNHFGIVFGSFWVILGSLSDRFGIMSGSFSDHFRIILGSFSDRFGIISGPFWDHFRTFSDRFRTILFLIFKLQISIGQGWGTAVADRRSAPPGPTAVPRPAPALADWNLKFDEHFEKKTAKKQNENEKLIFNSQH